jgi:hypothetical protein
VAVGPAGGVVQGGARCEGPSTARAAAAQPTASPRAASVGAGGDSGWRRSGAGALLRRGADGAGGRTRAVPAALRLRQGGVGPWERGVLVLALFDEGRGALGWAAAGRRAGRAARRLRYR